MVSDGELVASVRAGDDIAFEQLYERYGSRIGGFVAGMVGDAGRAEDVTQEVFLSALRRMRATERPIAFKPWIYEIARNAAIDDFRRVKRSREIPTPPEADGDDRPGISALPSMRQTPDAAVETGETLGHMTTAMGGLSDAHRTVLVLRELEGRSYKEIGEATGLSRPAVESALFRARRRLADEYQALASGERCLRVQALVDGDRRLRVRERADLRRHLSHCQVCRRHAGAAGFDIGDLGLVRRVAALFPLPAWIVLRRPDLGPLATSVAGTGDQTIALGKVVAGAAVVLAAGGTGVVASRQPPEGQPIAVHGRVARAPIASLTERNGSVNRTAGGMPTFVVKAGRVAPASAPGAVVTERGSTSSGSVDRTVPSAPVPAAPAAPAVQGGKADTPEVPSLTGPVPTIPGLASAPSSGGGSPTILLPTPGGSGTDREDTPPQPPLGTLVTDEPLSSTDGAVGTDVGDKDLSPADPPAPAADPVSPVVEPVPTVVETAGGIVDAVVTPAGDTPAKAEEPAPADPAPTAEPTATPAATGPAAEPAATADPTPAATEPETVLDDVAAAAATVTDSQDDPTG